MRCSLQLMYTSMVWSACRHLQSLRHLISISARSTPRFARRVLKYGVARGKRAGHHQILSPVTVILSKMISEPARRLRLRFEVAGSVRSIGRFSKP